MPSDEEVTRRAGRRRSRSGLTEAAWMARRPPLEPALGVSLQDRTLAGPRRTRRRHTPYAPGPLPTTARLE